MNFVFEVLALFVVPVLQLDFMSHEDHGEIDILSLRSLRSSWFIVLLPG
jgi:predicted Na+-dependent transporter